MTYAVKSLLSCPISMLILTLGVSLLSLASALTAQFVFDLQPCILCLYQRIPFIVIALISLIGLFFKRIRKPIIALCALAFFTNAGLAFYHHGVEQQWWVSAFEACAVPADFLKPGVSDSSKSFLKALLDTPSVPCSKIPWIDPVFGQSMAFWNILLCLGMGGVCGIHFIMSGLQRPFLTRPQSQQPAPHDPE